MDDVDFNKDTESKMTASTPKPTKPSASPGVRIKYYLHRDGHGLSAIQIMPQSKPLPAILWYQIPP
jgi:hypothetical protein